MEWQQLIGFYNLVRHESFTRGAEASFRTQSALSQQIKKLEDELDCSLISRAGRRQFTLTPAGERVFEFASNMLADRQRLLEQLSEIKGLPKGRLKIAAPFTTLYHLFPEHIMEFVNAYPHIELTVLDRPQGKVFELLRRGTVDIGVALESRMPGEFLGRRWKPVETVLIVPIKHPLLKLKKPRLPEISSYPLILPPRETPSRGKSGIEELFEKEGVRYRAIMESGNVELSSRYVEHGLGVAFGTVATGLDLLKGRRIRFIPLSHLFKPDHLCIVTKKDREVPFCMEAFISQLQGA